MNPITEIFFLMGFNVSIENKLESEMESIEMSEVERKFIMMARIGNLLTRKDLVVAVTSFGSFCNINVQDSDCERVIESRTSNEVTEQELLDWWSAIENDVE